MIKMNSNSTIKLRVAGADDLRDKLHYSGLFDMSDCVVEVECHPNTQAEELDKIVRVLEAAINVVDVVISSTPTSEADFFLEISEVPLSYIKTRLDK
jgi:hypothetical protein